MNIQATQAITIAAPAQHTVFLSGGANYQGVSGTPLFNIDPRASLTLKNLLLAYGRSETDGGLITNNHDLVLDHCTLLYGAAKAGLGGAIYNAPDATLTIQSSEFGDNVAIGVPYQLISGDGGAIYNDRGNVTIKNSGFGGNQSQTNVMLYQVIYPLPIDVSGGGGAIFNRDGTVAISDSTFEGNTAYSVNMLDGNGGAIVNSGKNAIMTINGVTFDANTSSNNGGAIYNGASQINAVNGTMTIINSTLTANRTNHRGGAIFADHQTDPAASISLTSVTIANNYGPGVVSGSETTANIDSADSGTISALATIFYGIWFDSKSVNCLSPVADKGYNRELLVNGPGTTCGILQPAGTSFALQSLRPNGGMTLTISISFDNNSVYDAIPIRFCPTTVDQRGLPRADRPDTAFCDIGAYEVTFDQNGKEYFPDIIQP